MRNETTMMLYEKILEAHKNNTNYFNNEMTIEEMYDILKYRMQFGESETMVILASLIKAGAKFR